jgi:hypothetical protein
VVQYAETEKVYHPSQKLLAGEVQAVTSDSLISMKWCVRQDVGTFSTLHPNEIMNIGKCELKTKDPIMKPKCTVHYSWKWAQ